MKSWEIALNDLKAFAASPRAGQVDALRSIEIAGGLVRDYTSGLEERLETYAKALRHIELVGCSGDPEAFGLSEIARKALA